MNYFCFVLLLLLHNKLNLFVLIINVAFIVWGFSSVSIGFKCWRNTNGKGKWPSVRELLSLKCYELLLLSVLDCNEGKSNSVTFMV